MSKLTLTRTDSGNADFQLLVRWLDEDLQQRNGDEQLFYSQFNATNAIKQVVVAYLDEQPAGCGAIKGYNEYTAEVKRMFVKQEARGKGIARAVLQELEQWAAESGFTTCLLETGIRQTEAIGLYTRHGYHQVPNYDQYIGVSTSVCMQKTLASPTIQ